MKSITSGMLPRQLETMYHDYSYGGFITKPAFAYDSYDQWQLVTEHATQTLEQMAQEITGSDPALAALEADMIPKLRVNWRDVGLGVLFMREEDLQCVNQAQASGLRKALIRTTDNYLHRLAAMDTSEIRGIIASGPLRCDKGKGAPIWSPGSDRQVALAYHRIAADAWDASEINQRIQEITQSPMPACQTSYIRIQASARAQPRYLSRAGRLYADGTRSGPKIRRVAAQPFSLNHMWLGVGHLLRTLMKEKGHITGEIPPVLSKAKMYKYVISADLKAYDTTVGAETLELVHELVLGPILAYLVKRSVITSRASRMLMSIDGFFMHNKCLLPPRHEHEVAWLADTLGMIRSGENLTSWKGSTINDCSIDTVQREAGIEMDWLVWGDDTVLFSNQDITHRWEGVRRKLGFEEEIAPGPSYLMRYLPSGHNFVTRMVLSTINREANHEPANVLMAAAAIKIRHGLLDGHPGQAAYMRALSSPDAPDRMKEALRIASASTDEVRLMQAASTTMRGRQVRGGMWDDLEQLIGQSSHRGKYRSLAASLSKLAYDQRRRIPFGELDRLANELSVPDAERMLSERSYAKR